MVLKKWSLLRFLRTLPRMLESFCFFKNATVIAHNLRWFDGFIEFAVIYWIKKQSLLIISEGVHWIKKTIIKPSEVMSNDCFLIQCTTANSMKPSNPLRLWAMTVAFLKKGKNKNSPTSWAMFSETPKKLFPQFLQHYQEKIWRGVVFHAAICHNFWPQKVECYLDKSLTKEILLTKNGHTKSRRNVW